MVQANGASLSFRKKTNAMSMPGTEMDSGHGELLGQKTVMPIIHA